MKIAYDSGPLKDNHKVRGIGMMVKEQIEGLKQEIKNSDEMSFHPIDFTDNNDLDKYDLVHYPYFFPFQLSLPSKKPTKKMVVTIQDLIQLIYPKAYPAGFRAKINFIKQRNRIKNADAIITISETSKKDIIRFLGVPPDIVHVVYLASKEMFKKITEKNLLEKIREKYNLPKKFVLYVGDINFNKNLLTLIRAAKIANTTLVIVGKLAAEIDKSNFEIVNLSGPRDWVRYLFGKPHPEVAHHKELIKYFRKNKIIKTGFVSDEDLSVLYNLASVYVQPSYYEGFGMPVVEAMRSGCPVIVSKTNALVEIAGEAAMIADPYDENDMAKKIQKVITDNDLRNDLIKKGFEREKYFSWKNTSVQIVDIYKNLLGV